MSIRDRLWERIEKRFSALDEIRDNSALPTWQRAEAESRRAELARTWNMIGQVLEGTRGDEGMDEDTCCRCDHDCACGDGCCYCGECESFR